VARRYGGWERTCGEVGARLGRGCRSSDIAQVVQSFSAFANLDQRLRQALSSTTFVVGEKA